MNTAKETYAPRPLWTPPEIKGDIARLAEVYHETGSGHRDEAVLGQSLAAASQTRFKLKATAESPFYRAGPAIEQGNGNCMAHSEVVARVGQALGLDMMVAWNGTHATTLFLGRVAIWRVDGYSNASVTWFFLRSFQAETQQDIRELHAEQQGGFIYVPRVHGNKRPKVEYTPPKLGDTTFPSNDNFVYNLVLPVEQGINFFGATGDLKRYSIADSRKYTAHAEEIRTYIPRTIQSED
jgi:hypothetical protein